MCEICSKLTIKTPERRQRRLLVFLLLTLNIFHTFFIVFYVDFEQVYVNWEKAITYILEKYFIVNKPI